ncbi:hypothetical protein G7Y89_g1487 [Cudoniella acicularis]|uniref:Alpha/beta hydrolase fold-3 domain-containing protein n=1 Tax=Cudoniella acicularis TaxID=354080 RepID=A0A8H4RVZ1_9HELO|nr:hypothetical protein G7Y89_g1487 [Cudoniella acicularis]
MALKPSGQTTRDAAIALMVIATLGLVLRILSKIKTRQRWAAEDALIILALLLFYGFNAVMLYGMYNAGGTMEFEEMSLDGLILTAKTIYINEMFMTATLTSVKFSILLWYRHIFSIDSFRKRCNVVLLLCAIWAITVFFVLIFQCIPIKAAWDPVAKMAGKCINIGNIILGYEISNILLDISILALPIAQIRKVHISTGYKFAVASIFSLGGFIIIACILRVNFLYEKNTLQVDNFRGMLWSNIELAVAVLCGCLPALRPLFPHDLGFVQIIRTFTPYGFTVSRHSTSAAQGTYATAVEFREGISLKPGKEKDRFTILPPSDSENYKGPASDSEVRPGVVGSTWYPAPYDASDKGKKVVLHLHGGAYVMFSGREVFSGIEARAMSKHFDDAWVFCPDYRLANVPNGRFPAALQDAITSYRYLTDALKIPRSSIIVSGDSAGGHLVLNLLRYLVEYDVQNLPLAAALWSPWTNLRDPAINKRSRNANVDFLDHTILLWGSRAFTCGRRDLSEESELNSYISPFHAPFNARIPICITYGTAESLYESILDFIQAMQGVGNKMTVFEVENAPHDPLKTADLLEDTELTKAMFVHTWNFVNDKA